MLHHPCTAYHRPDEIPAARTCVVFGQHRGGTSMIAGLLHVFGIPLGERIDRGNNEDLEFQTADVRRIHELIGRRNDSHPVWGFKDPASFRTAPAWYRRLRSPFFIAVVRDVVASAQGEVGRGIKSDVLGTAIEKQREQGELLGFLARLRGEGFPLLLVSYERAIHNGDLLVDSLAEFLGVALDAPTRERAIEFVMPERGHGNPDVPPGINLEVILRAKARAAAAAAARP